MAIFFFFSKLITSAACSLKGIQNIFIQSFPQQKLCLFSIISNVHIFYIEYPQKYVHLFLLLKISLDYYLDLAEIIRGDLSDFIYWLNFNILFYRADKAIPQKSLLLHTFL